ncbi:MAG: chemotaxis-specific protein-glutamate methyltransferase CheB [Bdellovibrionales bacterium]|nr:chemotaxis-specific protein-glutamate methyltransferase CheB [Bdellovibrionales bacterium]
MEKVIRILIADDSRMARQFVRTILSESPGFEIVAEAVDMESIRNACQQFPIDVVLLDMNLLDCTGIEVIQNVLAPVGLRSLILSAFTPEGSKEAIQALGAGAADVLQKPVLKSDADYVNFSKELTTKLRAVAGGQARNATEARTSTDTQTGIAVWQDALAKMTSMDLITIGASTGGTEAIHRLLAQLPKNRNYPPILILQHMPPVFTKAFAEFLSTKAPVPVCEAHEGQVIEPNRAYVAPGDYHLTLERDPKIQKVFVRLNQSERIHGVRPAVDYGFDSVASLFPKRAMGIILTGMGRDGAEGLLKMRNQGCLTIGQSESTCVVYGMPKAAREVNATHIELDLEKIATAITQVLGN